MQFYRGYFKILMSVSVQLLCAMGAKATEPTYCTSAGGNTYYEWIKEVKVNGVSSQSGADKYKLFSAPTFQVSVGANSINLSAGYRSYAYVENWSVFIDLNRDGIFDASEKLLGGAATQLNGVLNIPQTVQGGATRMRISMQYGASPKACGNFSWGEVEDYTVILPSPPPPPMILLRGGGTLGLDKGYEQSFQIRAKYKKNGQPTEFTNIIMAGIPGILFHMEIEADQGTEVEWQGHLFGDGSRPLVPVNCAKKAGNSCFVDSGVWGTMIFTYPIHSSDQLLAFESIFGGNFYQAGPTVIIDGITAKTNYANFYNFFGFPFSSGYFGFLDLELVFPYPVTSISFLAAGTCTNCVTKTTISGDGVIVGTIDTAYNTVAPFTIHFPVPVTRVTFDKGFNMDNLSIDYAP